MYIYMCIYILGSICILGMADISNHLNRYLHEAPASSCGQIITSEGVPGFLQAEITPGKHAGGNLEPPEVVGIYTHKMLLKRVALSRGGCTRNADGNHRALVLL